MSKQPSENFTFELSIEAYILNPMKSCIMEDETLQDQMTISFPKNISATVIIFFNFGKNEAEKGEEDDGGDDSYNSNVNDNVFFNSAFVMMKTLKAGLKMIAV